MNRSQCESHVSRDRREFLTKIPFIFAAAGLSERVCPAAPQSPDPDLLVFKSARELAQLLRYRKLSCQEVMKAQLKRVQEINNRINAVVLANQDELLAQAKAADEVLQSGHHAGPLHGIPVTIKDEFETAGIQTTIGTSGLVGHIPKRDATVVKRLKAAGAIVLGKTNVPELLWANETDNFVNGRTSNPYRLTRTPGGSSGGEAALISAGGSPLGIGSDAAGSIRLPAHYCGLAGLKPTWGLVPTTGSLFPMGPMMSQFDSPGPLARSVEDLAYCLPILAGPDHVDPNVFPVRVRDYRSVDITDLKIAYFTDDGFATPIAEIKRTVIKAAKSLERVGAKVVEELPPCGEQAIDLYGALSDAEMNILLRQTLERYGTETDRIHPLTKGAFAILKEIAAKDNITSRVGAHQRWLKFRRDTMRFLQSFDALICPADAIVAPKHGESWKEENFIGISYSMPANLTGTPSVVVRCGTSSDKMPIGVQVVSRKWRDDIALAVAVYLEDELGGWKAPLL